MFKRLQVRFFRVVMVLFATLAWAHVAFAAYQPVNPQDPYEKFNRVMYRFNDFLDTYALKPVATLYVKIVPKPLVKGITNVYANIDTIPTVVNDVLQGNIYQATNDAWRLAINSSVGIIGFFDVATQLGLEPNKEDFGLTLARWGYTNSNYLVLPFFGPSSLRDGIGIPVDYYVFSIYPHINPIRTRYEVYGLGIVSRRADLLRFQSVFDQAALDRYVFLRDAYMQRRAYLIQRNKELGNPYLEKNNTLETSSEISSGEKNNNSEPADKSNRPVDSNFGIASNGKSAEKTKPAILSAERTQFDQNLPEMPVEVKKNHNHFSQDNARQIGIMGAQLSKKSTVHAQAARNL